MSSKIFQFVKNILKFTLLEDTRYTPLTVTEIKHRVGLTGTICFGHGCYVFGTKCKNDIVIKDKYTYTSRGMTQFMIVDISGKHYNVNNSIWFNKWDSIEDWTNIEQGQTYKASIYGIRIPILGVFPNIFKIDQSK